MSNRVWARNGFLEAVLAVNLLAFVAGLLERPHSLMGKIALVTSLMSVIGFGLLLVVRWKYFVRLSVGDWVWLLNLGFGAKST